MNFLLYLLGKNKHDCRYRDYCQYPHKNDDEECDLINEMYENKNGLDEIRELNFKNIYNFLGSVNSQGEQNETKRVEVSKERRCRPVSIKENVYQEMKKRLKENCPKMKDCPKCGIDKDDCPLLKPWNNKEKGSDEYTSSDLLLGEYLPESKRVVLYVKNIDYACEKEEHTYNCVLSTYIHELFHAYFHYFTEHHNKADYKDKSINEIEEAMAEFSTLVFLRSMKNERSGKWSEILDWAKKSIGEKQKTVGDLPAYGFGLHLFENLSEGKAYDWINKYAERLGSINKEDELVKQYKQMVYPCYPSDPDKCLELLRKILFETNNKLIKPRDVKVNRICNMGKIVNPWTGISWKKTIADCDKVYFDKNYGSPANFVKFINSKYPSAEMTFGCLPEPFSGDINSPVYCLNMNPGKPDPVFNCDKNFEKMTQLNLDPPKLRGTFWTRNLKNSGKIHDGVLWLESKTAKLRKDIGVEDALNLFFVDYFPYHSTHGFHFPKDLPSYEYRNYLVEEAMNANKIIIIMRQGKDWFSAIPKLRGYDRLITLRCPAGGWLSDKNFNYGPGVTYNDLINALK